MPYDLDYLFIVLFYLKKKQNCILSHLLWWLQKIFSSVDVAFLFYALTKFTNQTKFLQTKKKKKNQPTFFFIREYHSTRHVRPCTEDVVLFFVTAHLSHTPCWLHGCAMAVHRSPVGNPNAKASWPQPTRTMPHQDFESPSLFSFSNYFLFFIYINEKHGKKAVKIKGKKWK